MPSSPMQPDGLAAAVREALTGVLDPEIRRPITDLGMVRSVLVDGGTVTVRVDLTVAACPLKDTLVTDVTAAVQPLEGVTNLLRIA